VAHGVDLEEKWTANLQSRMKKLTFDYNDHPYVNLISAGRAATRLPTQMTSNEAISSHLVHALLVMCTFFGQDVGHAFAGKPSPAWHMPCFIVIF
jgi:hypothetical protein